MNPRQRIDVWLWRTRLARSRAAASDLVSAGNVRLQRAGRSRRLEKPSTEVEPGDTLVFIGRAGLKAVRIVALPSRRGPLGEAKAQFCELDADRLA